MEGVETPSKIYSFADLGGVVDSFFNEYDFLIEKRFGKHYQILAKYAYYDAYNSQAAVNAGVEKNTQKLWLQGSVNF